MATLGEQRAATAEVDRDLALELYRTMLLIRGFEDRVQSLFLRGEVYGTTHLYSGQEAVATGFAERLADGDRIACTYRGHGHLLAMGTDPEALLAELLGRATGINGGRAGSMNIVDPEHGVLGCYGIVGGSIAAATGAALALADTGSVAVAYFGDGAANQAYFFECLNFAKVFALPVVFVCENNGYGEYTPTEAVTPGGIQPRAAAMELPTTGVDGMDVWAVRATAAEVVGRVRAGGGPELVEAITYRFVGHSRSDPGKYRPEGELERWQERDPLRIGVGPAPRGVRACRRRGRRGRPRARGAPRRDRAVRPRRALPAAVRGLRVRGRAWLNAAPPRRTGDGVVGNGARRAAARDRGPSEGFSLREMARRLDVSPSLVSQIETGKIQPSVRTLYAIVSELGVSLDAIFDQHAAPGRRRRAGRRPAAGDAEPASTARPETAASSSARPTDRASTSRRASTGSG